jgi:hypothetical protein
MVVVSCTYACGIWNIYFSMVFSSFHLFNLDILFRCRYDVDQCHYCKHFLFKLHLVIILYLLSATYAICLQRKHACVATG